MRGLAGPCGVEPMGDVGHETEELAHHGLPFVAMGARPEAILEMMYQPVSHLMRNHLDQEGLAILVEQNQVEAQTSPPEMGLAGTLAAQVTPDTGSG